MNSARPSTGDDRALRRSAGFTAIELVLAVVVTCIVAAVLVSAVRTYAIRAQVTSGLQLALPWRAMVEVRFRQTDQVPRTWGDLNAGPEDLSSVYVQTVQIENGRIDIVYGNDAASPISGRRVSLMPYETPDGSVVWLCGDDGPGPGLEPLGFASGGAQPEAVPPTIGARYLPAECR